MTGQKYDNNHNLGKCPETKKQKQKQGLEGLRQRSLKKCRRDESYMFSRLGADEYVQHVNAYKAKLSHCLVVTKTQNIY